jgi:hypothetical protein
METEMADEQEHETFVIRNTDGSVSLDPYAGKSREQLKMRCGELCRALDVWQHIAMSIAESGKEGLSPEELNKLNQLIEAYND